MRLSFTTTREEDVRTPERIAGALNRITSALKEMLNHGISDENRKAATKDVPILTAATLADTFPVPVSVPEHVGKPVEVRAASVTKVDDESATLAAAPFVQWRRTGDGIAITNITGLAVSTRYVVRLRIEGE